MLRAVRLLELALPKFCFGIAEIKLKQFAYRASTITAQPNLYYSGRHITPVITTN
jgi:hypothetical protein